MLPLGPRSSALSASVRLGVRDAFYCRRFHLARPLSSIASATGCPALFGDFMGTTGLSDFAWSFIVGVRPWTFRQAHSGHRHGRPGDFPVLVRGVSVRARGLTAAGSRRVSRYRRAKWGLAPLLTASASRRKVLSRLNTPARTCPCQRFDAILAGGSHDSGSVSVAGPSPYDAFIHYASPVFPAHRSARGPHGRRVSTVTAYTAHREWARRPPDERCASVHALAEAARARRIRTDARITETVDLQVQAVTADALAIRDRSGPARPLTHWSFEQLAGLAGAPPAYLRTLPAPIASDAINYGLQRADRAQHQLFADRDEPWTIHAITSPRYARVHHDKLADRVLDLMAQHPAWHVPLGYKDGVFGAERVPSGAYLGDRDMYLLLVDGNQSLDDPTDGSQAGLFRGFMLRNSDVGAAALSLDMFLFRAACANHVRHVIGA